MLAGSVALPDLGLLMAHPHAIKERAGADRIGVRVTRRAGLAEDVALNSDLGRLCPKIGAAFDKIRPCVHALPCHYQTQRVVGGSGCQHHQIRRRIRGI